ncbi:hypothetical protein LZC95_32990 [Pendulispora brunnea]|uniref:Uncharacterized protein n=1 Tax=Pendulispora brunnea TaxID=2905690 RepID=A0ABZ2JXP2_9BACT
MKIKYAIPALAMLSLSTVIGASASAQEVEEIDAAAAGKAHVTVGTKQYDFTASVCDFTGRGPQLKATLRDGTKLTVSGPSDFVAIEGPSVNFGGWVEDSSGDNRAFKLSGTEDGGSRKFTISATCAR